MMMLVYQHACEPDPHIGKQHLKHMCIYGQVDKSRRDDSCYSSSHDSSMSLERGHNLAVKVRMVIL